MNRNVQGRSARSVKDDDIGAMQGRHLMRCWSSQADYAPLAVARTEGCWIHTRDGRKIFDLRSAHECANLGFNHPKVIAALKAQMDEVIYVTDDFATEPAARLSRRLAELTPGSAEKRVFFSQSGAAAVEAAIKGARLYQHNRVFREGGRVDAPRQYPYPYKIISCYQSWHGSASGAASVSGDPRRWFQEPLTVPGAVFAPGANPYRPHFESVERHLDYLEHVIEQEGDGTRSPLSWWNRSSEATGSSCRRKGIWRACGPCVTAGIS